MKKIALAALVMTTSSGCFTGCNHKKAEEAIEPPPSMPVTGSATEPPKPLTAAELTARYDECLGFWNENDWDKLKTCWAADASGDAPGSGTPPSVGTQAIVDATKDFKAGFPDMKGEPQLELVHGHDLVVVSLLTGTHTGPFSGPAGEVTAMNQKIGFLSGQVQDLDDQGNVKHDHEYYDSATMLGQLAPMKDHPVRPPQDKLAMPKEVVIAKNDAAEQANVATANEVVDAFNKHYAKALGAALTDDVVWSEQQNPKDWTKAEAVADAESGWKAFSDLKMVPTAMWAAGSYVVTVATIDGTNDGAMPEAGLKHATKKHVSLPYLAVQKIDGGKVKATWVFAQGMAMAVQLGLAPAPAMAPSGSAASGSAASGSAGAASGSAAK